MTINSQTPSHGEKAVQKKSRSTFNRVHIYGLLALGLVLIGFAGYKLWKGSDVIINDELIGMGSYAKRGSTVIFDYTAYVHDLKKPAEWGQKFDSTLDRKAPRTLVIGAGQTIPGLERALMGMREGGQRRVLIPPGLGYGKDGAGDGLIPPGSTLLYEIQLRAVR